MWAVPGSHKTPTDYFLKLSKEQDKITTIYEPNTPPKYNLEGAEALDAEQGSIVLLHGDLVHFSHANVSDKQRHAYTLHVVESRNHKWAEDNWIQRPNNPFRFLYHHNPDKSGL